VISGKDKKWIVRTNDGVVQGPFSTESILSKIKTGELTGDEQVALFPSTDWFPISSASEFYDSLLAGLEGAAQADSPPADSAHYRFEPITETPAKPKPKSKSEPGRAERVSSKKTAEPKQEKVAQEQNEREPPSQPEVIELQKTKRVLKKAKAKRVSGPFLILILVLLGSAFFLLYGENHSKSALRLLAPRMDQPALSQEQIKASTQSAVSFFVKNDIDSLIQAQSFLVRVAEGDPKNAEVKALLCLTYFELWPFAQQDSQDLNTITKVTQGASRLDPVGTNGATCRTVELIIRGRTDEADSLADSIIETVGATGSPPTVFYYLKALLLQMRKDYGAALNYAQAVEPLWPTWLAPKMLAAELAIKANQPEVAVRSLNQVLKANPNHIEAQAYLGIVEIRMLKNVSRGQSFLDSALAASEKISPEIASEGYLTLAEQSLSAGDSGQALILAKKSLGKSSTNQRARALVVQLGGEKSLKDTKLVDRQLVYEGDQLVREGDCSSAQALFKTAFELNGKNAIAAMKAADCLWKLGLGTEAIDWLNKAITSDTQLIDAYVALSDYYSQRYLFQAAARVLSSANSVDPKNYKVFRGLGRLELRRRNGQGAVQYATQATTLYEGDVESYVILSRAYMLLNDYNGAIVASRKARELDVNSREAQIVYAESLFGAQGAAAAIDYLVRLVTNYPMVSEYRLALGDLYLKDQNYKGALEMYEQVARLQSKPKEALLKLGQVQQRERNFEQALSQFIKAATLDPSDPEPLFLAGKLYLDMKKPNEAKAQFQRILNINKEYPLVNYNMGVAFLSLSSAKEALEQAKLEIQKNPRLADPYILAAEAYDLLGQYSLCASEYQKAVQLRPQGSMMYVKMARCYRLSGNLDASLSMINIANTQESGNPEVWKEQALVYEAKGNKIKAIEAYDQYLVLAPNAADTAQVRERIDNLSR